MPLLVCSSQLSSATEGTSASRSSSYAAFVKCSLSRLRHTYQKRCRHSSLSSCGPCTLPCARGGSMCPSEFASWHQYPVPAQTKLHQFNISRSEGLPMDQQSNLRSFLHCDFCMKQPKRFEAGILTYHFLHSLQLLIYRKQKKSPSSSSSTIRALRWLGSEKINFYSVLG